MRITIAQLRQAVQEAGRIGASPEYMKKERIREKLQQLIAGAVASGEVTDQTSLDQVVKDIDTAMTALKVIPFEVWTKIAGIQPPIKRAKKR